MSAINNKKKLFRFERQWETDNFVNKNNSFLPAIVEQTVTWVQTLRQF